jgi:hypothetical protein
MQKDTSIAHSDLAHNILLYLHFKVAGTRSAKHAGGMQPTGLVPMLLQL